MWTLGIDLTDLFVLPFPSTGQGGGKTPGQGEVLGGGERCSLLRLESLTKGQKDAPCSAPSFGLRRGPHTTLPAPGYAAKDSGGGDKPGVCAVSVLLEVRPDELALTGTGHGPTSRPPSRVSLTLDSALAVSSLLTGRLFKPRYDE